MIVEGERNVKMGKIGKAGKIIWATDEHFFLDRINID